MTYLKQLTSHKHFLLYVIIIISLVSTLPWLGLGNFYTRGEPREAVVAMAMLQQENFILPTYLGEEMAFKPPLLHWLVATASILPGNVSVYTSRLPSAVAACLMFIFFFSFMSKRMNPKRVFLATLLLMSCFEIHRASMTCRVDMLLTSLTVLSLLAIYKWNENKYKGWPILTSLLISGSILTKGPVGVILPCFILFVYMLLQREKISTIILSLTKITLLSAIIPIAWYIGAYLQRGDLFLELVMEENLNRFLGKMAYESHENGAIYNVYSLLAGLLPWILPVVFALFTLQIGKPRLEKGFLSRLWQRLLSMDKVHLFSLVAAVCIFTFYCIPKSKRSVYTMPMYPFTCLFLAEYIYYLYQTKRKVWRAFAITLTGLSFALVIFLFSIRWVDLSALLGGTSRSSLRIISQLSFIQDLPISFYFLLFALLPAFISIYIIKSMNGKNQALLYSTVFLYIGINLTLDSLVLPAIKNSAPDYYLSEQIKEQFPGETIYSFRAVERPNEPFYTIGFYLDNRIQLLTAKHALPEKGHVLIEENRLEYFEELMKEYRYKELFRTMTPFTSVSGNVLFYEFEKK